MAERLPVRDPLQTRPCTPAARSGSACYVPRVRCRWLGSAIASTASLAIAWLATTAVTASPVASAAPADGVLPAINATATPRAKPDPGKAQILTTPATPATPTTPATSTTPTKPATRSNPAAPTKPATRSNPAAPTTPTGKPGAVSQDPATKPAPEPAADLAGVTDDPLLGGAPRVNGDEVHGVVAFTFDDGPNPETTPAVIDALEKYDIPATFFIVTQRLLGKRGEKSREVLARELTAGFLIGDHSNSHINLRASAGKTLNKEIDASIRTLAKEAARPIGLFRPPYGALSTAGRVRLKKLGVTEVIWSIDTLDWRAHNEERLRKKVLKMILADNGGIVLMHDVKPITAKVIGSVLDDLEAENCQRLKDQKTPIVPVSIHYFLRDGQLGGAQGKKKVTPTPRAIPDSVTKRTEAYKAGLAGRCAARPPSPPAPTKPPPAKRGRVGDFGLDPTEKGHKPPGIGVHLSKECLEKPLAKGCP